MPRSSDESTVRKRAPRKRAATKRVSSSPRKTARKRATKKAVVATESPSRDTADSAVTDGTPTVSTTQRKAPTPLAETRAAAGARRKQLVTAGLLLVFGFGASAAVGYTDAGQINVQETIEQRNERILSNSADERDTINSKVAIPVQNTNTSQQPDGGLRGLGTGGAKPEPKPEPPTATTSAASSTTTATSSAVSASSTEAGISSAAASTSTASPATTTDPRL